MSLLGDDDDNQEALLHPTPCPLLTFVTPLTSAHSLLGSGQDPRRVDDADALQDLVLHLGTLESGLSIKTQRNVKSTNHPSSKIKLGHVKCK